MAENNASVTLLPLRVTHRGRWEMRDDILRVQKKIMAEPQKIFRHVQRSRKKRLLRQEDNRKCTRIDKEGPE